MKQKNKLMALMMALMLLVGAAVGGTVAWLIDTTDPVENVFVAGDIEITLEETSTTRKFTMVPGKDIAKDPTVTVIKGSEACWLFVKVEKSSNFDTFMTYNMAEDWTALTGVTGVYYREVAAIAETETDAAFPVLAEDKVTVKESVTKEQLTAITTAPTLTFTAYAVQKDGVGSATNAWEKINPSTP